MPLIYLSPSTQENNYFVSGGTEEEYMNRLADAMIPYLDASGIRIGENLLGLNNAKISSNIIAELPYVGQVRVGIKLPNTVKIEIKELDVVYSIEADDGSWWLVRSDGVVIEKTNSADAELYTKILGVKITGAEVGKKVTAAQPFPRTRSTLVEPAFPLP